MKRFSQVLFVYESGVDNAAAFRKALDLVESNQATLTVIGVIDQDEMGRDDRLHRILIDELQQELTEFLQQFSEPTRLTEPRVLSGRPFVEIIREVLRSDRDIVVKAQESARGRSMSGTDMRLLRKCPCPVWLVRDTRGADRKSLLVAVAYEPDNAENDALNRQLLQMGSSMALAEFAELHVVHAWTLPFEERYRSHRFGVPAAEVDRLVNDEHVTRRDWLDRLIRENCSVLDGKGNEFLTPNVHLIKGAAAQVVVREALRLNADLVIMGTIARTGISGFFIGNTAENIIHQLDSSILAVKPGGFESPVH